MTPPRIAVVTPYFRETTGQLRRCHEGVLAQDVEATHFLVADGHPDPAVPSWSCRHVVIDRPCADFGDTPRALGSMLADGGGFDFVAYLDADNYWLAGHLRSLLELHERTRAPVLCAWRRFVTPGGDPLDVEEADEVSGEHVDTSCLMIHRAAFGVFPVWTQMPPALHVIGDRVIVKWLRHRRFAFAHSRNRTVAYVTHYAMHFRGAGVPVPAGAKELPDRSRVVDYLRRTGSVMECVDRIGFWPG